VRTSESSGAPERVRLLPTWRIGLLNRRAHRLLTEHLAAEGFTGRQYRLLAALIESGACSQADLGQQAGLDRSDVAAAVDALAVRTLITKERDSADHRRNIVTATPEGIAALARLDEIVAHVQVELLSPLTASERALLDDLLGTLLAPDR
jgi:MarR family transcriptional regulator, lower aerobic nicotinate degradation pathway regulator